MTALQAPGRLGFVIGRSAVVRAVDRNRLRRRWREAVRTRRPHSADFDIVFRVRTRIPPDALDSAALEGRALLDRLLTA